MRKGKIEVLPRLWWEGGDVPDVGTVGEGTERDPGTSIDNG